MINHIQSWTMQTSQLIHISAICQSCSMSENGEVSCLVVTGRELIQEVKSLLWLNAAPQALMRQPASAWTTSTVPSLAMTSRLCAQ